MVEAPITAKSNVAVSGNCFTLSDNDFTTINTHMISPTNILRSLKPISKSPNSAEKLRPNPIKILKRRQEGNHNRNVKQYCKQEL